MILFICIVSLVIDYFVVVRDIYLFLQEPMTKRVNMKREKLLLLSLHRLKDNQDLCRTGSWSCLARECILGSSRYARRGERGRGLLIETY